MPFGGAGLIATPARPSPRSSSSSTIRPPNEWPIRTGGSVERADERGVVVDDLLQAEAGELVRVLAELLDVAVLARPLGRGDGEAALAEVVLEALPAARRQPRAVDQQQRDLIAVAAGVDTVGLLSVDAGDCRRGLAF